MKNALFQNKALGERTMFDFNFMITLVAENHCFSVWRIITVFQPSFRAVRLIGKRFIAKKMFTWCAPRVAFGCRDLLFKRPLPASSICTK